jgi:Coenzyme PQQ synthesis protein D (PqqD)
MTPPDWHWEQLRGCRAVVPDNVVFRGLAEETILLNIETGQYHGLDRVGGRFFEVIRESEGLGAASRQLADEYGQPLPQIEADLAAFCVDLESRGLIQLEGDAAGA